MSDATTSMFSRRCLCRSAGRSPPKCLSPKDAAKGLMCQLPPVMPLGVLRQRAEKTQPWATKALISCAIQVGKRDRADVTSLSSEAGNFERSF